MHPCYVFFQIPPHFFLSSMLIIIKVALFFVFAGPCEIVFVLFSFDSNSQEAGSLGKREDPGHSGKRGSEPDKVKRDGLPFYTLAGPSLVQRSVHDLARAPRY
jgi:hypothetical protein